MTRRAGVRGGQFHFIEEAAQIRQLAFDMPAFTWLDFTEARQQTFGLFAGP